ncbi:MAG: class I tRNA ligase family protein [Clostridiales bacterium]|nr:MAG: class I tRNA ligase family protein [Clostridiales bacterium]
MDFALWKSAKEGEISWDSPWGKGRPGWHIECSAMNRAAFGDQIDIHGGGRDLIFPHHENEIAQSEALTGKKFVKYWIHNGLIKVNGQKMSKSLGNSLLLEDLLKKYSAETIKFALLQTNYRADINVTDDLFPTAEKHLVDFYRVLEEAEKSGLESSKKTEKIGEDFVNCMDDDFNTALAISNLFGYFKTVRKKLKEGDVTAIEDINAIRENYDILGLFRADAKEFLKKYDKADAEDNVSVPEEIFALAEKRKAAKAEKNYALADEIRKEIADKGFILVDTKDGFTIKKA